LDKEPQYLLDWSITHNGMNKPFFRTEGKHGIWKCWKEYLVRSRVTGRGLVAPKQLISNEEIF